MKQEKIFQVSEFNEFISTYLGSIGEVVVEGEISEFSKSRNKWLFITIKDKENSVEVFGATFRIRNYDLLEEGMLVHVYGVPGLYKKNARFNISANRIVPAGEGALKIAFEKLKEKLKEEGLFAPERKRKIPEFPTQIGLITAKDSSAYEDFVKVLKNRMGGIKIYFYPVNVQGNNSVPSILQAFKYFNQEKKSLDLIALTRGGGSLEDLQSFNDEQVARTIFSSKIPVATGIGHEDDWTIADFVADMRASTPSNLAAKIVRDRKSVIKEVNAMVKIMDKEIKYLIDDKNRQILKSVNILNRSIKQKVLYLQNTINNFKNKFDLFIEQISNYKKEVKRLNFDLIKSTEYWLKNYRQKINQQIRLLKNMDIREVLKRGFSITTNQEGKLVKSIMDIKKGEKVTTKLVDGKINSEVLKILEK